ncbi:MAG: hypothetical protein WBW48_19575 [Anaerolineae bacterium]
MSDAPLGGSPAVISKTGIGAFGQLVKAEFGRYGVSTDYLAMDHRTQTIGFVLCQTLDRIFADVFLPEVLRGVGDAVQENGFRVLIHSVEEATASEAYIGLGREKHTDDDGAVASLRTGLWGRNAVDRTDRWRVSRGTGDTPPDRTHRTAVVRSSRTLVIIKRRRRVEESKDNSHPVGLRGEYDSRWPYGFCSGA